MIDSRNFFSKVFDFFDNEVCPNCRHHGGVKRKEEVVNQTTEYTTIMQEEKHYDADGQYKGSTQRPVQVMYYAIICDKYLECKICSHEWVERDRRIHKP
jgi:hypothetical protein